MTTLMRWNPVAEFSGLRRAMDILEDFAPTRAWRNTELADLSFPFDLFETDDHVVVKAVLPGIKPDDVEIAVSEGILTIKGEAKREQKTERDSYHRREIYYGAFSRSIPLPTRVNYERAEAEFENGVLTVTLPKAEDVRPKSIQIKSKQLVGAGSNGSNS